MYHKNKGADDMITWVKASDGNIPDGAFVAGYEDDGNPLFVARAEYQGSLNPGKVRKQFGAANIPYNQLEVQVNPYEVLVGAYDWKKASGGSIPLDAIVAGRTLNGEPYYVVRAKYECGLHPGKLRFGYTAAHIPYGGVVVEVDEYEVLVYRR